jgi:transposase
MSKVYRPYYPEQDYLLAPSLRDWLPESHLAYFVSDLIDHVDLSPIESHYEREERGYPPYHPRMMTKLLVYGYCVGVFSSRKLEKRLVEDVAFRVLAAGNEPDFRTISEFRRIHLKALEGLFVEVLRLALKLGAMKLGRVAIDGSKVKANASKHKPMSYQRMQEDEKRLKEEVRRLLAEAEQVDREEDRGHSRRGDELPAELHRREQRLKRIAGARQELKERARAAAEEKKDPEAKKAMPEPKDQHNFTDPQSRIMKGPDGFVQAYNAQIVVEPELQLIVGQAVTQQANDKKQFVPMIDKVEQQAGQKVRQVLVDSGYCSEDNIRRAAGRNIDLYAATGKQKHNRLETVSPRGRIAKSATLVERMKRKLRTRAGRSIYALRKTIVEPVFGQIKQAQGFRQFLLRGYEKVQSEWALVCTTHNILKLYRLLEA